jgi:competence protein ComGC
LIALSAFKVKSIITTMDFLELKLPIPENVYKKSPEIQKNIYEYLKAMNELQKTAYLIAYNHLGSSFNILRSNGYIEWNKNKIM